MASPHHCLTPSRTPTIFDPTAPLETKIKNEELEHSATSEPYLEPLEPRIVSWDGPNDPNNPQNWSYGYKWFVTLICGLVTLNVYVFFFPHRFVLLYSSVG
jgi:hypothetical protein